MSATEQRDAFMRVAFAPLAPGEKAALATARIYPDRSGGSNPAFTPRRWRAGCVEPQLGLHFNTFAFKEAAPRARLEDATRAFVVMLDDVGDIPGKSHVSLARVMSLPEASRPHAIIRTRREGDRSNGQAMWLIVPVAAEVATALVRAALAKGWGDAGATATVRWARPPGSLKLDGNGHPADYILKNLDASRIGIGALADALGVPDFMARAAPARAAADRGGRLPEIATVRSVVSAITNDLDRAEWVRSGLALKACVADDAEGFALFDEFSRRHETYDPRATETAWRGFRPGRIGFGTLVHLLRRNAMEIGSGALVMGDGSNPQCPICIIAPDATLARAAMTAFGALQAIVVADFEPTLAQFIDLPLTAQKLMIIRRGESHRAGAEILYRKARAYGVPVELHRLNRPPGVASAPPSLRAEAGTKG